MAISYARYHELFYNLCQGDNPLILQPTFLVLAARRDREFIVPSPTNVNIIQQKFQNFSIIVFWQFMAFTGEQTSRSLIPRTFTPEEIAVAPQNEREDMASMALGFDEVGALDIFARLKRELADSLMEATYIRMSDVDKKQYEPLLAALRQVDIFLGSGISFSQEYVNLLLTLNSLQVFRPLS